MAGGVAFGGLAGGAGWVACVVGPAGGLGLGGGGGGGGSSVETVALMVPATLCRREDESCNQGETLQRAGELRTSDGIDAAVEHRKPALVFNDGCRLS